MMNEKDLQELKEMTGLVCESELGNTKHEVAPHTTSHTTHTTSHTPTYDRRENVRFANKELLEMVGRYVKVGKTYGIIDDVHGNMLGYVHCENETWTGELVEKNETILCTTEKDIRKAHESALAYFTKERESVKNRIDRKIGTVGEQATLAHMLWKINKWLGKLAA